MLFSLGHGQHVTAAPASAPRARAAADGADASPPTEPIAAVAPGLVAAATARALRGGRCADGACGGRAGRRGGRPRRNLLLLFRDLFCPAAARRHAGAARPSSPRRWSPIPTPPRPSNSSIPSIFTYFGQFIDHDITANTDRDANAVSDIGSDVIDPVPRPQVRADLGNLRAARWGSTASTATTRRADALRRQADAT